MLSKESRAYCAGLYEGEGSINFYKSRGRRAIRINIQMTDRQPLELFQDFMGVGTIYGPYQRGALKPIFQYQAHGFEAVQFIVCNIWSWLTERREHQIVNAFKNYTSHIITHPNMQRKRKRLP